MIPFKNIAELWAFSQVTAMLEYSIKQEQPRTPVMPSAPAAPSSGYDTLTEAEFAQHFMPRIAVPDHERWLSEDLAGTEEVKTRLKPLRDLRYGPGPLQVMDLFPARRADSPIFVFIHGGYWRALSKDHYGFIAEPFVEAGAAVALMDYDLCPAVHLETIVEQVAQSVRRIRGHAREINGDPDRIVLGGNSAGGHLAAMLLSRAWDAPGEERPFIRGASLVTGIYDLSPIPRIQVRDEVHLTAADIARLSPLRLEPRLRVPSVVSVGGDEPKLWIEQSRRYHDKLVQSGMESEFMIVPGHHHFSITRCLAELDSPLFRATLRLLQS
jgi:arylformamidase